MYTHDSVFAAPTLDRLRLLDPAGPAVQEWARQASAWKRAFMTAFELQVSRLAREAGVEENWGVPGGGCVPRAGATLHRRGRSWQVQEVVRQRAALFCPWWAALVTHGGQTTVLYGVHVPAEQSLASVEVESLLSEAKAARRRLAPA